MTLTLLSIATLSYFCLIYDTSMFLFPSVCCKSHMGLKHSVSNLHICSGLFLTANVWNVPCLSLVGLFVLEIICKSLQLFTVLVYQGAHLSSWTFFLVWDEILICLMIKFVCMYWGWRKKHEISKRLEKCACSRCSSSLTSCWTLLTAVESLYNIQFKIKCVTMALNVAHPIRFVCLSAWPHEHHMGNLKNKSNSV